MYVRLKITNIAQMQTTRFSVPYKGISLFIKLLATGSCLFYIYFKIVNRTDFNTLSSSIEDLFKRITAFDALLLLGLMFANWAFEAAKWKMIVEHIEQVPFLKSIKAVLVGIAISVFTPNRAGEFVGRIFFLNPENRLKGILITLLGSAAQLLITLLTGALALLFYTAWYTNINGFTSPYLYSSFAAIVGLMVLLLPFVFLNISLLSNLTRKTSWLKRLQPYINALENYSTDELVKIILLSFFRYVLFTLQFYILLRLLNVTGGNVSEMLVMIALTFFAITVVPTITVTEPGVRGAASLAFIGQLSDNAIGIVTASFALWIINIALPAVAGSVFIFRLNIFRNKM